MSEIIGFRPNDGGGISGRIDALVKASGGRINKSDILRAALDSYLARMEASGKYTVELMVAEDQAEPGKPRTVPVTGGEAIKAGASAKDGKPMKYPTKGRGRKAG